MNEELDINAVKQVLVSFAQQALTRFKGFAPFGAFYSASEKKVVLVPVPPDAVPNQSDAQIAWLHREIRSMRQSRGITAAGVCKEVTMTLPRQPKVEAIHCMLEESSLGLAVDVVVPYRRGFFGGIKLGDLIKGRGELAIFLPSTKSRPVIAVDAGESDIRVDPATITHAFVMLLRRDGDCAKEIAALAPDLIMQAQPRLWSAPPKIKFAVATADKAEGNFPDAAVVPAALEELGAPSSASILIHLSMIGSDRADFHVKMLLGFCFVEASPRVIITEHDICIPA